MNLISQIAHHLMDEYNFNLFFIQSSTFIDNKAVNAGGAIYFVNSQTVSDIEVSNCVFQNCQRNGTTTTASTGGGAIYISGVTSATYTVRIILCQFTNNT